VCAEFLPFSNYDFAEVFEMECGCASLCLCLCLYVCVCLCLYVCVCGISLLLRL